MQTSSLLSGSQGAAMCRQPVLQGCRSAAKSSITNSALRCRDLQNSSRSHRSPAGLRAAKQEPGAKTTQVATDAPPHIPSSALRPVEAVATNGLPALVTPSSNGQAQPALPVDIRPADNRWYTVIGLSALAALICSVDRAAISVAILPMSEQYHWSDSTKGAINR